MFNPEQAFFLQWHITDQCNLQCRHCYRDSPKPDIAFSKLKDVFENFKRLRALMPQKKARIQIAGGEPLLSPNLFPVLDLAAEAGFPSRILTNGSLIDGGVAKQIKAHGCSLVQISIDGSLSTHDSLRGEGNYLKAIEGARHLREAGIQVTFAMTLSRINLSEISSVFEAAQKYADRLGFHRLVPCGRGTELKAQFLRSDEIQKIFTEIFRLKRSEGKIEVPLRDPLWRAFFRCPDLEPYSDGCSAAYGGICIDSNADVYACRRMPVVLGNALSEELTGIWNSAPMSNLRNRDLLKGKCGKCGLRWKCGGCRAISHAVTGDMFAEDPQCFCTMNLVEKMGFKLLNWAHSKGYLNAADGGG